MNLFNIAQERLALMAEIEANDGELSPEMEEALAINQADFDEKATAYFHMIRQTEGEQSAIDAESSRLALLSKSKGKMIDRLKGNLLEALKLYGHDDNGIRRFNGGTFNLSTRKSTSTEILDESLVPDEFKVRKETFTISKTTIKNAIELGQIVPGAELKTNYSLQIK